MPIVFDHEGDHPPRWATAVSISGKVGCSAYTPREWVKKAEVNSCKRAGVPTEVADRVKALECEGPRAGSNRVIHRLGSWRSFEAVKYATLEWVDWFNHRRPLQPIGNIPPTEAEAQYHAAPDKTDMAA